MNIPPEKRQNALRLQLDVIDFSFVIS